MTAIWEFTICYSFDTDNVQFWSFSSKRLLCHLFFFMFRLLLVLSLWSLLAEFYYTTEVFSETSENFRSVESSDSRVTDLIASIVEFRVPEFRVPKLKNALNNFLPPAGPPSAFNLGLNLLRTLRACTLSIRSRSLSLEMSSSSSSCSLLSMLYETCKPGNWDSIKQYQLVSISDISSQATLQRISPIWYISSHDKNCNYRDDHGQVWGGAVHRGKMISSFNSEFYER
jgi:hypothetical protein